MQQEAELLIFDAFEDAINACGCQNHSEDHESKITENNMLQEHVLMAADAP